MNNSLVTFEKYCALEIVKRKRGWTRVIVEKEGGNLFVNFLSVLS